MTAGHRLYRRLRRPRSLRTTVTAAATLVALIVVILAGIVITVRIHDQDLHQVDHELSYRVTKVRADATKLATAEPTPGKDVSGGIDHNAAGLDAGSQTTVLLYRGTTLLSVHGDIPPTPVPTPTSNGYRTLNLGGQHWRSLVVPIAGGRIQLLQNLAPVRERLTNTEQVVAIVAIVAALLTAAAVWLATTLALEPLRRLRAGAAHIRANRAHDERLPAVGRPQEVVELTSTLNAMLDELDSSTQATRRFTADAGHELRTPLASLGMDLETLRRNPGLASAQRTNIIEAMTIEHGRLASLLDGLQKLARGDAHALPNGATIDVADLIAERVARSRQTYPHQAIYLSLNGFGQEATIEGWPDGLGAAVTNLLDNAARHGRPDGTIHVTVEADSNAITITIDDEGPGIAPQDRGRLLQRFTRGNMSTPGSGLGLAIAQQQASLHNGILELDSSPKGGLRARIRLPPSST